MSAIVEAREVSRWYGMVMGLNHISFALSEGITGFVGPNGAGKSTLIQIITGQLRPSSGTLTLWGEIPYNNPPLLARIGYCPERESVRTDLDPLEWLSGLGLMSGVPRGEIASRCEEMLERVRLPRVHWRKKLSRYSKGMRQRVKLAQALMHGPDLLVLDEPMNGLDPLGRQEIAAILKEQVAQGVSVLISSHILAELESLCRDLLIMNWGRILASGQQSSIRSEMADWTEQISVRVDHPMKLVEILFRKDHLLGFDYHQDKDELALRLRRPEEFYRLFPGIVLESGIQLREMRSQSRSLSNIFDRITH